MRILFHSVDCDLCKMFIEEIKKRDALWIFELCSIQRIRNMGLDVPSQVKVVPCLFDTDTMETRQGRPLFDFCFKNGGRGFNTMVEREREKTGRKSNDAKEGSGIPNEDLSPIHSDFGGMMGMSLDEAIAGTDNVAPIGDRARTTSPGPMIPKNLTEKVLTTKDEMTPMKTIEQLQAEREDLYT